MLFDFVFHCVYMLFRGFFEQGPIDLSFISSSQFTCSLERFFKMHVFFKGIVLQNFLGLQMFLIDRTWVPVIQLKAYFLRFLTVFSAG